MYIREDPIRFVLGVAVDHDEFIRSVHELSPTFNIRSHRRHWVSFIWMRSVMQSPQGFRSRMGIHDHHRIELLAEYSDVARCLVMVFVGRYLPQSLLVDRKGIVWINQHSIKRPFIVHLLRSFQEGENIK